MADWFDSAGMAWLIGAGVLAIVELAVPGVFLIFLAAAAAITGAVTLLFPDLPVIGQLASFGAWSAVAVAVGRKWYGANPIESDDPLLNDRMARYLGETVTVITAIDGGAGRVKVGDSEWPARGADAPVGTRVRITGADGTAFRVEAVVPTITGSASQP